jgi:hypothetical protein
VYNLEVTTYLACVQQAQKLKFNEISLYLSAENNLFLSASISESIFANCTRTYKGISKCEAGAQISGI